jgi:N-acetylglucosamine-6-phosphate deacetylase
VQTITGLDPSDGQTIEISIRNGVIEAIRSCTTNGDLWLSPGLVDLQVNGYGGEDVNLDGLDPATIISLTHKMIANGVTTYLPTIITASEEKIIANLRAIQEARRLSKLVAQCVPYVHIEGPHISQQDGYRGAHPVEHIRPPTIAEFDRWQHASGNLVGMVTVSPHFCGTEAYIFHLVSQRVHVALGHTHASAEEIRNAVNAGARLSTHLGNGIASMIPRHPNAIWSQLADDRLTAMLIADGHHLPADTLKAMIRAKGIERAILVSDAVSVAGLPPAIYDTVVGGRVQLDSTGRLSLAGTPYLAGAASALKTGVARAMTMTGISLAESVRMATENPGRVVGGIGRMIVGMRADLVAFCIVRERDDLQIERVILNGEEWG